LPAETGALWINYKHVVVDGTLPIKAHEGTTAKQLLWGLSRRGTPHDKAQSEPCLIMEHHRARHTHKKAALTSLSHALHTPTTPRTARGTSGRAPHPPRGKAHPHRPPHAPSPPTSTKRADNDEEARTRDSARRRPPRYVASVSTASGEPDSGEPDSGAVSGDPAAPATSFSASARSMRFRQRLSMRCCRLST